MNGAISAIAGYVPERCITNDELARSVSTSDEWIVSHTGIRERRIAPPDQASSDLGIEAGKRVLARRNIAATEVDLVIAATSTPDYAPFPATAAVIQDRLGCTDAGAFDLQAGCTGFVYALDVARALVVAGSKERVLVVGTEKLSSITDWSDRSTCVLFGDGAGAAIVEAHGPGNHEILTSELHADGAGDDALIREVGGTRRPYEAGKDTEGDTKLRMDGKRVYLFAVDAIVKTIRKLCDKQGLRVEALDWIVPHQANLRIIEAAAKRLSVPVERFYTNLDRYANTSAASIPLALEEMEGRDLLSPDMLLLSVGFGAGLTYGGNIIRW